jgi:alkylhydroperoxidase/carboxymuconolactone decarboxylase family protein YurZ
MILEARDVRILRLFAAVVLARWDEVERLRRDAPAGEPDRAWREAVLQSHVFAGFPRTVEAYGVLQAAGGLGALDADEALAEPEQRARGEQLFATIYRDHAERVTRFLHASQPDFAAWILGHAYGRVLTRPGLSSAQRELLAVVGLAAFEQQRQLASHVRGALRCGACLEQVHAALEATADLLGAARTRAAREIVARFGACD